MALHKIVMQADDFRYAGTLRWILILQLVHSLWSTFETNTHLKYKHQPDELQRRATLATANS